MCRHCNDGNGNCGGGGDNDDDDDDNNDNNNNNNNNNEMTEAFTAGVMIFIEQFRARWPWSIRVLES